MNCRLIEDPEPTDWCNVRFRIAVGGETVELLVSWDGSILTPVDVAGTEPSNLAARFLAAYTREHALLIHALLGRARHLYEAIGGNEHVGTIPSARVEKEPRLTDGGVAFDVRVNDASVEGTLAPDLRWVSRNTEPRTWATARHCVLGYAAKNVAELSRLGFDTSTLARQLADRDENSALLGEIRGL
jgi:hypothetical protein